MVKSFGYPWDVVQCAIESGKEEAISYLEKDVAPGIVEEATLKVTERAYKELLDLFKGFVITIAAAIIVAVLKFVGII